MMLSLPINYGTILREYYPDSEWYMEDEEDYDTLVMDNPPSKELLDTFIAQQQVKNYISEVSEAVTNMLNSKALELGYDSITSARSYAGYDNKYQIEARSLAKWSSKVWHTLDEMSKEASKYKELPSLEDILDRLPKYKRETYE